MLCRAGPLTKSILEIPVFATSRRIQLPQLQVQRFSHTDKSLLPEKNVEHKEITPSLLGKWKRTLSHVQNSFFGDKVEHDSKSKQNLFLFSSVAAVGTVSEITEPIPEPPPIPSAPQVVDFPEITEVISQVNKLGEPTFASLGLGGYTPSGWVQNAFEYLHVTLEIPWWGAIAIGTVVIRLLMFPLVVVSQQNAAKMNNCLPQLQALQLKMTEARQMGNYLESAKYTQELQLFMKEKNFNPLKSMVVPLAQMPVFLSFFWALREMANLPVDSMRTGGLWWFTDLTVPDQFYIMPLVTCVTLLATIELGVDSGRLSSSTGTIMKYGLRALPIVIFPFIMNFPGAMLCYWCTSNFISLLQVGILKIPTVRDFFNIEPLIKHDPMSLPVKPKGFTEGVKESWTNIKITKELEARRQMDDILFQRAGKGPLVKTFKYDPTKIGSANSSTAISAKKR